LLLGCRPLWGLGRALDLAQPMRRSHAPLGHHDHVRDNRVIDGCPRPIPDALSAPWKRMEKRRVLAFRPSARQFLFSLSPIHASLAACSFIHRSMTRLYVVAAGKVRPTPSCGREPMSCKRILPPAGSITAHKPKPRFGNSTRRSRHGGIPHKSPGGTPLPTSARTRRPRHPHPPPHTPPPPPPAPRSDPRRPSQPHPVRSATRRRQRWTSWWRTRVAADGSLNAAGPEYNQARHQGFSPPYSPRFMTAEPQQIDETLRPKPRVIESQPPRPSPVPGPPPNPISVHRCLFPPVTTPANAVPLISGHDVIGPPALPALNP